MSDNLGTNFNKEEKDDLLNFPSFNLDEITGGFSTSDYLPEGTFDFGNPLGVLDLDQFSFETNYFNTTNITKEIIEKVEKEKEEGARTPIAYKDPLKKNWRGSCFTISNWLRYRHTGLLWNTSIQI